MLKEIYHPNACLETVKNVRLGLRARTKILNVMEGFSGDAKAIAKESGMHYNVVLYHLKLLEREKIVQRKGSKPYSWSLTGLGQKRLVDAD